MKRFGVWLLFAATCLLPPEPCIAAEEVRDVIRGSSEIPVALAGKQNNDRNLSGTTVHGGDTKWQRNSVVPRIQKLMEDHRVQALLSDGHLEIIKQSLAQANINQMNLPATTSPSAKVDRRELTLEQSLEIALRHNLDIRIAELTKEAVGTEVPRAQAKFHPTVGLGFTGSGAKTVVDGEPDIKSDAQDGTLFLNQELPTGTGASVTLTGDVIRVAADKQTVFSNMGVSVTQPLLRGGGVFVATRQISDAEFDLRVEEARLRSEILKVMARTKSAYYNLLLAEKVIAVTEDAIQRDKILLEASKALFDAGLVTRRDLYSAEISLANDSAQLVNNLADRESARNRLMDVLGLGIETDVRLMDRDIRLQPVQMTLSNWIERALKDRPEILAIEEQRAKSALNVRVARNTALPQADLITSYNKSQTGTSLSKALDFRGRGWSVGLLFSYPIWNQAAKSELARAEIEHRRFEDLLVRTKRQIELEVRASVIKINRSLERIKPLTVSVEQAMGKLEIAKARFALGQTTNFDITDAQEDILNAETDLLRAIVDYNIGLAELEAQIAGTL